MHPCDPRHFEQVEARLEAEAGKASRLDEHKALENLRLFLDNEYKETELLKENGDKALHILIQRLTKSGSRYDAVRDLTSLKEKVAGAAAENYASSTSDSISGALLKELLKERVGALMHELENVRRAQSTWRHLCADPDPRFKLA